MARKIATEAANTCTATEEKPLHPSIPYRLLCTGFSKGSSFWAISVTEKTSYLNHNSGRTHFNTNPVWLEDSYIQQRKKLPCYEYVSLFSQLCTKGFMGNSKSYQIIPTYRNGNGKRWSNSCYWIICWNNALFGLKVILKENFFFFFSPFDWPELKVSKRLLFSFERIHWSFISMFRTTASKLDQVVTCLKAQLF